MLDPNGRSRLRMWMPHAPMPAANTSATTTRAPGGRIEIPLRWPSSGTCPPRRRGRKRRCRACRIARPCSRDRGFPPDCAGAPPARSRRRGPAGRRRGTRVTGCASRDRLSERAGRWNTFAGPPGRYVDRGANRRHFPGDRVQRPLHTNEAGIELLAGRRLSISRHAPSTTSRRTTRSRVHGAGLNRSRL